MRRRTDPEAPETVINTKRALLYLPLYLVWAIAVDVLFDSASPAGSTTVPAWMVVGFVISALAVAGIALWYLVRRAQGKVPEQRHHIYLAILVAVFLSGFVGDGLKGIASLLLGGRPWWALAPIYTVEYAAFWGLFVFAVSVFGRRERRLEHSDKLAEG